MAKARMLHKTISLSEQVNNLSLPAQLIFTWLIPHADDEGRLKGNPKYIKALVVPYHHEWTLKEIETFLQEIEQQGLIHIWDGNDIQYIEFPTWKRYQYIAKDRFHKSELPSYKETVDNASTPRIQNVSKTITQSNAIKDNKEEIKKSESNNVANNSFKTAGELLKGNYPDPLTTFHPSTEKQSTVFELWKNMESHNPKAFYSTYLPLVKQSISSTQLYIFYREIKQDKTIKNPGAVFNKKVDDYCTLMKTISPK